MAALVVQPIAATGTKPTYAAAGAGGDTFTTGDHVFLHVVNGNAASCVVTLVTPPTVDGFAVADDVVTILTGSFAFIGPLTDAFFRDPVAGVGAVSYSVTSTVTVALVAV